MANPIQHTLPFQDLSLTDPRAVITAPVAGMYDSDICTYLREQLFGIVKATSADHHPDKLKLKLLQLEKLVEGFEPRDVVEACTAIQMATCHELAMYFMELAYLPNQPFERCKYFMDKADKLMSQYRAHHQSMTNRRMPRARRRS